MAYIGNTPAEAFSAFQKQDFSTSATTSYTLDHPVSNQNEIALFINFVRQEPTAAYTASGTTLTLTSATSGSDDMYCVYLGKAVQTVNPPSGSVGSSQVAASIITGQTALGATPADTDELLISDAGTLKRVDYSYLKSSMTPAFYGELASTQTISRNSYVKVTGMTNDEIDTNTAFDGTTFTVPSGEGGTYFLYASIQADFEVAGDDGELARCYLYKNGSELKVAQFKVEAGGGNIRYIAASVSVTATLSASDTIELYTLLNDFSGNDARVLADATSIGGYKLIT
nr:c1q globular head like domain containing protein [uncultured Mediterranean phage uvMED]